LTQALTVFSDKVPSLDAQAIELTRNILNMGKEERRRFLGREETLLLYNKPVGIDCDIAACEVNLVHICESP
jgi:hypothetical protein